MPSMKKKILLVEDSPELIDMMRSFLTVRGYGVLGAGNGCQAIEIADAELPDLIVMDVLLPGMDGIQTASEIRKNPRTHHIPLLAFTGESFGASQEGRLAEVFSDFLLKPTNLHQLEAKIQKLLKQVGKQE